LELLFIPTFIIFVDQTIIDFSNRISLTDITDRWMNKNKRIKQTIGVEIEKLDKLFKLTFNTYTQI